MLKNLNTYFFPSHFFFLIYFIFFFYLKLLFLHLLTFLATLFSREIQKKNIRNIILSNPPNVCCNMYKAQSTNSGGKEIKRSLFFFYKAFQFGAPILIKRFSAILRKRFCQNICCPCPHNPLKYSGSLGLLRHIGAQTSCLKSALSSTHKNASCSPFPLVLPRPREQDCPPQSSYHTIAALADMVAYTSGRTHSALSKVLL